MHSYAIPQRVIDRAMMRRGRVYAFEAIDPAKTALLVIDMQNGFLDPKEPGAVAAAREVVPNVNRLAAATRMAGGHVIWVKMTTNDRPDGGWAAYFDTIIGPETSAGMRASLREGAHGHDLWPDLVTAREDSVVNKNRFSAFIAGASDIEAVLSARGLDTLIVVGTLTNVCCDSSARDAMMLGYKVLMVSDANATHHDDDHAGTLNTFLQSYGDVRTTGQVIGLLEAGTRQAAAE